MAAEADEPAKGEPAAGSAQPRQFIVTVYGLYSRTEGGWLSVATLIGLLADLGIEAPAVRSSISRLKRRGLLRAERRNGSAGYALSDEGLSVLREGDLRIFRRDRATPADGWLLAVFSVPESERSKRHLMRSRLTRLGFGTASAGVYIAPAHLYDATAEMLRRLELDGYADLFRADHLAFGPLEEKVRQWWDLDQLELLYGEFVRKHADVLDRLPAPSDTGPGPAGRDAFVDYVRVLTDWRQLPYLDPGLPAELLPDGWVGIRAADLFFTLRSRLEDGARAYVAGGLGPEAR
ncbi:PaaX family transcriptional regulator C-terminal domain-containing protein [Streptomyces sp. NBC_01089]|uniref:PaaX family transcriptional regulator n=1 Tax=Streptomyces sp. NBC_01089 TaxID=2903747 RepID=UPI003863E39D|nr:PaaX family transcriptional regulator [Streptomyces sp. NBC_01089]